MHLIERHRQATTGGLSLLALQALVQAVPTHDQSKKGE